MMPADAVDQMRAFDAVLLGAVGRPDIPDHMTLWGLLLPIRQRLDLWANVRPVRLLEGVRARSRAAAGRHRHALRAREHRGRVLRRRRARAPGPPAEVAIETAVFTRAGVERVVRHAFELAGERRGLVTSATKSNASRYGYVLWDEVAAEVAARHPGCPLRARPGRRAGRPHGAAPRQPRRRRRVQPLRRHPDRPRRGPAGRHGHGRERQHLPAAATCPGCSSPSTARRPTSRARAREPVRRGLERLLMLEQLGERGRPARLLGAARGGLPRRPAHARPRRHGDDRRGRSGDPRAPAGRLARGDEMLDPGCDALGRSLPEPG